MPRMPNVIPNEIVEADWGNDIRDRTVQRYATVAARTSGHATPAEGDLSYLEDLNEVHVYTGAAWTLVGQSPDVDGYGATSTDSALTTAFVSYTAVNLSIPASWASWKCTAWANYVLYSTVSLPVVETRIIVDGTNGATRSRTLSSSHAGDSLIGYRAGIVTTGSRTVALSMRVASGTCSVWERALYVRATRVT